MMINEVVIEDIKFWNELSYKLDPLEIRILELIYMNKSYVLGRLINDLKNMYKLKYSKPPIIKRLEALMEFGLIVLIRGKPLVISSVIGIEENIKVLLTISKERYQLR